MRRLYSWFLEPPQIRWLFDLCFKLLGFRSPNGPKSLRESQRILIVRPGHLGDLILTSAFLREFRQNWPNADITLLVNPPYGPFAENCPYVDRVVVHPRFQRCRFGEIRQLISEVRFAGRHFWPRRFDLAVVPRWDTQIFREPFLAYFSGARWRVGFSEEGNTLAREGKSCEVLYTHLVPSDSCKHEVEATLDLLTWIGGAVSDTRTEVWVPPSDREFAATMLPISGEEVVRVAMVPGSSSSSRRWPATRFGELAAWMKHELGWEIVLIGSPGETEVGEIVEQSSCHSVINLIGRTTVTETIAVIERCRIYVGNDTGPMHVAAGLGLPVVEISCHPADGSPVHERSPARFGAWGVPAWVAQPATGADDCRDFCARGELGEAHCVLVVSVDQVKSLVLEAVTHSGLPVRRCQLPLEG